MGQQLLTRYISPLSATIRLLADAGNPDLDQRKMYWNDTSTSWVNLMYIRSLFNNGRVFNSPEGTSFHIQYKNATPAELKFVIYQVLA